MVWGCWSIRSNCLKQCFINGPSSGKPATKCLWGYFGKLSPFNNNLTDTVNRENSTRLPFASAFLRREHFYIGIKKCTIVAPSQSQPGFNCLSLQAGNFRPIGECLSDAINSNEMVSAPISCLLACRSPLQIALLIIPIIVNSLKAVFIRASTHIGQKIREMAKARINCNASCSVVLITRIARCLNPTNHRSPRSIFSTFLMTMLPCFSVLHYGIVSWL